MRRIILLLVSFLILTASAGVALNLEPFGTDHLWVRILLSAFLLSIATIVAFFSLKGK